ncbi:DNA topoisomerase III [Salipaludibacillus neizhouensis]|uniref:DNA topoisomerase n=1 Tax=Salipaludibacillus neizhouensis TaxID=885475 RepID=A0A3A9KCC3_9BACI|nr:type IA DNA topoisomerase [Salipaludibacillus neizhouensis]RKL69298.1 DNA topoisomerase III [Salipaludibacillus neizhouensis]
MKLIVAEKPDQGAKLAAPFPFAKQKNHITIRPCETFPQGAVVTWAVGHLCELLSPDEYDASWKKWQLDILPMIPSEFQYKVTKTKWKAFKVIKDFVHDPKINEIIIAGDAEREGEAIVRLVLQQSKNTKPMKRLWISSLTPNAVITGFQNLKDEIHTRDLFHEAISRAYADWLVGMNASRAFTLLLQHQGAEDVFSTGRVQTPTLALIVKRETEIEAFRSENFWEVKANFQINNHMYEGTWHKDGDTRLKEEQMAKKIAQFSAGKPAKVTNIDKNTKNIPPPYLFNLSGLQSLANKRFKYAPKQTLDIAQKLYVKGIISYPRTDSAFITKEEASTLPDVLAKLREYSTFNAYFPLPNPSILVSKRYVNPSKVKDHYAIIPTDQTIDPAKLSREEQVIYEMIVERVIAAHYDDCKMSYSTIDTLVDERATFRSKGKQLLNEGWRKVIPFSQDSQKSAKDNDTSLPPVQNGDEGIVSKVTTKKGETKPPKRYTEGDLILVMKTAGKHIDDDNLVKVMQDTEGLGTEATRAGIIGILKDRSYITVTKNQVFPTDKGRILIQAVGDSILASPEMTAKWEQRLAEIGDGKTPMEPFIEQAKKLSASIIQDARMNAKSWQLDKEKLANIQSTRKGWKQKKGTGNYPAKTLVGGCLKCDGKVIDKGNFYGCTNYNQSKCTFTISKRTLGKEISITHVKELLSGGTTSIVQGFERNNNVFDAALKWDNNKKKIIFIYDQQPINR